MQIRIVVADQGEARFYDAERVGTRLRQIGRIEDDKARLHDRDFKSDRPGRVFGHAPAASGRRGAGAHHGTGGEGERRPHKHEAHLFADRVAQRLEEVERENPVGRIVLMAAPAFLGLLREALPKTVRSKVVAEVHKDLVHQDDETVRAHVPPEAFSPV